MLLQQKFRIKTMQLLVKPKILELGILYKHQNAERIIS